MADDVEESEVFEITDFTTASEWERFIARLEQIIHDWKLTTYVRGPPLKKGEFSAGEWEEQSESINFATVCFTVTEHRLKQAAPAEGTQQEESEDALPQAMEDMLLMENDFPPRAHCICRWYGLRHFVVLTPVANSDAVLSESKINLLLSSMAIAVNNTNCLLPIFAQIQQKWRRMYTGICEAPGVRTTFDMVHLKRTPHQYSHMEGLLNIFKSKLATPISPFPPVKASIRFTYVLHDWTQYAWSLQPPDMDSPLGDEVGYPGFKALPFGAVEDPISELHLSATWPSQAENTIVDNDVYSDLDPSQAPQWSVRLRLTEKPQCLLGEYLSAFAELVHNRDSTDQLLGKPAFDDNDDETSEQISQALQRLTDPGRVHLPTLSSVVSRARTRIRSRQRQVEAPIAVDILNELLVHLFPDAANQDEASEGDEEGEKDDPTEAMNVQPEVKEWYRHFKSGPEDSITYKLAVAMCVVNHSHGGLKAVAHLWQEFVLEMRYRWENMYLIPGLASGNPNMGCCLLHQKLQMLNCCISRKKAREERQSMSGTVWGEHASSTRGSSDQNTASGSPGTDSPSNDRSNGVTPYASATQLAGEDQGFAEKFRSASKGSVGEGRSVRSDSDSEEEFFECDEDSFPGSPDKDGLEPGAGETEAKDSRGVNFQVGEETDAKVTSPDVGNESRSQKPSGRLRPYGDLKLLNKDELLYIPVTQDPAPMTEDMLEEHAEVLAQLGTSSEGAELRAKMQSACLLSDMQAFKAANPGCELEDFVRWYSPRDWIEHEEDEDEEGDEGEEPMDDGEGGAREEGGANRRKVKGSLSQRMMLPGNTWQEVWSQSKPVPAHLQKRLFDDTKEAEKVLHFLASLRPGEVVLHLLPLIVHAALRRLETAAVEDVPSLQPHFPGLVSKASRVTRAPTQEIRKYEELVKQISLFEEVIARSLSLKAKFLPQRADTEASRHASALQQFVSDLMDKPEVPVIGAGRGPVGQAIHQLFGAAQRSAHMLPEVEADLQDSPGRVKYSHTHSSVPDFPRPAGREFIFRAVAPRPAPYSQPTPQRMYCVLVEEEFRLAGAFSQDTTFQ
ncbi:rab3 GTPase-activating protein catalytic subunit-like [Acanthaster planci]|uniref:Rab3 GTPase-activating protein catalytic subunit n=1 Tax=Acanthaster planci TaxID=133434 RepID=A0A8B8A4I4_ACAPL|nr:rab3 GTPase-activating protein catalytic subunit-like [Acanthaster planci]